MHFKGPVYLRNESEDNAGSLCKLTQSLYLFGKQWLASLLVKQLEIVNDCDRTRFQPRHVPDDVVGADLIRRENLDAVRDVAVVRVRRSEMLPRLLFRKFQREQQGIAIIASGVDQKSKTEPGLPVSRSSCE